ncbi:RagB/SusD family nutrient uptake outer membrane protein [Sphingobacterium chuzhouense]|uniref:RagB/SusD family nutrient uptake outer membrane protein n=1 Tax=Sphingobacterium chuzhouense TaxID=1742264 RepID=A0ABR7XX45_9SPHI|nr:RagB/SusD family nutrient uptake outer membrane protein [Sphingobacterium chuzhouense]MBD1423639.1 RagB/SusD family nutrient uptake outer membrane protein [Sphingobacterium chuzhouense]
MKKKIFIALLTAASFASCDIDRAPYGSMDADDIMNDPDTYMESMINGAYGQLKAWSDPMHRAGEYAGDNIAIRGTSTDAFFEFISYNRTPNNGRLNQFWNAGYKAIAQTSNVINMFEEGQSDEIDNRLGECYYIRGLMYFYFVRAYGRPYYDNPQTNLGMPIVNGTPEDIPGLELDDRVSVAETYEHIIADLEKAEELLTIDNGPVYASRGAVYALLSRVYVYMSGTYEAPNTQYAQLAVDYADKVINSGDYSLLPRERFMQYNTYTPENNPETIFAVKRIASEFSGDDHFYGVGGMYANIGGQGWGEMYASAKYIDLLNETGRNDWREEKYNIVDARAAFIAPTYSQDANTGNYTEVFRFIRRGNTLTYAQATVTRSGSTITCRDGDNTYTLTPVNAEQEIYRINHADGNIYTGVLDNFITVNNGLPQFFITKASREGEESHLHSPVISRLGEVYLNRAEAYAKLGNYGAALADLNEIRTRSIVDGAYSSLNASNASSLIDKERQLELAFQAERSYDVYRNGGTLTRHYPGAHNQTLEVGPRDFRVVYYIPQDAINAYPGKLTQNPTSN